MATASEPHSQASTVMLQAAMSAPPAIWGGDRLGTVLTKSRVAGTTTRKNWRAAAQRAQRGQQA